MYVLTKGGGWYVSPPGSARSYTRDKAAARRYPTAAAAAADACGNEWPVEL